MQLVRSSILAGVLLVCSSACQSTRQSASAETRAPRFAGRTAEHWIASASQSISPDVRTLAALIALSPHDAGAERCVRDFLTDLDPSTRYEVVSALAQAPDACHLFETELVRGVSDDNGDIAEMSTAALLDMYVRTGYLTPTLQRALDGARELSSPAIASALNSCAWTDVAPENPRVEPRDRALRFAEAAVRMTDRQQVAYLDTLAWALFWADRRSEAVKVEQEVLAKARATDPNRPKYDAALARFSAP
ncbi:MAG: hypothetical protein ACKVWV_01470 [Planctomycetota bacterium]